MNETWFLPVDPHPADRRTVDEIRIMRIGVITPSTFIVEVKMRDRFAILTYEQSAELIKMLTHARAKQHTR